MIHPGPGRDQPAGVRLPTDRPIVRLAVSAALLAAAITVVVGEAGVRRLEAWALAGVAGHLLGLQVVRSAVHPVVYLTMPAPATFASPYWIGLAVTSECSSAWLVGPLLGVAGLLVLGRRLTVRAVAVATAATAVLLVLVNLVRLTLILVATHTWGLAGGYRWSHEVYGSLLTVVGVCGGLALFFALVVRLSRRQLRARPG